MAMKKAVKLEILVLMEPELPDEEIIKWAKMAMLDFCEFEEAVIKIVEKHERMIIDLESNAMA